MLNLALFTSLQFTLDNYDDDSDWSGALAAPVASASTSNSPSRQRTKNLSSASTGSFPANLHTYVQGALEVAEGQLGRPTSLRKISVVSQADNGGSNTHLQAQPASADASPMRKISGNLFRKVKKSSATTTPSDGRALVFEFASNSDEDGESMRARVMSVTLS